VQHLKVFGSITYAHVPKAARSKLDDKAVKTTFDGGGPSTTSHERLDPKSIASKTKLGASKIKLGASKTKLGASKTKLGASRTRRLGSSYEWENDILIHVP